MINLSQTDTNVIVSVKDEGLGISPKQLPHIFGQVLQGRKKQKTLKVSGSDFICAAGSLKHMTVRCGRKARKVKDPLFIFLSLLNNPDIFHTHISLYIC